MGHRLRRTSVLAETFGMIYGCPECGSTTKNHDCETQCWMDECIGALGHRGRHTFADGED